MENDQPDKINAYVVDRIRVPARVIVPLSGKNIELLPELTWKDLNWNIYAHSYGSARNTPTNVAGD